MALHTTYIEARANLAKLCERVTSDRETVIITRRGAADVALIAADELTSLLETAHLLRSPKNAERLLSALNDALAVPARRETRRYRLTASAANGFKTSIGVPHHV